jgi:hypothetical protein
LHDLPTPSPRKKIKIILDGIRDAKVMVDSSEKVMVDSSENRTTRQDTTRQDKTRQEKAT